MQRFQKSWVFVALHDLLASWIAFGLALGALVGRYPIANFSDQVLVWGGAFAAICAVIYLSIGLSSTYWRYTSIVDIRLIVVASGASVLVWLMLAFSITRLEGIPRAFPFILFLTEVAALTAPRAIYRLLRDRRDRRKSRGRRERPLRLLLVGGPSDVYQAINWASSHPHRLQLIGILGGKQRHVGLSIQGVRVLGTIRDLSAVLDKLEVEGRFPDSIMICASLQRLSSDELDIITTVSSIRGVRLHRDFQPDRILGEVVAQQPTQPLSRLLGRPETGVLSANPQEKLVGGKRVLITGAGGTIGAEVARYVAAASPARLGLLDVSEYNLYQIHRELQDEFLDLDIDPILCNIRDQQIVRMVIRRFAPDIVIHAAALKHVDMVEQTPREGVLTNIFGTINVAEATAETGAAIFVLVSTDKAVSPTSVMGQTKRLCELYVSELDNRRNSAQGYGTRFISVRFGNVIGSSGSVVPLFRQQIERNGPVTVTHPEMERYFMTVREAAGLILQAAHDALLNDRRRGRVFVLEMGKPIRILDLARQLITSAGLLPDQDIKIVFTGLRPGERLSEKLFSDDEDCFHTSHPGVLYAEPRRVCAEFSKGAVDRLFEAAMADDQAAMIALLDEAALASDDRRPDIGVGERASSHEARPASDIAAVADGAARREPSTDNVVSMKVNRPR